MFERYTEEARRAIFFARYEACRCGSPYIEPEHLLLGLMHGTVRGLAGFPESVLDEVRSEIEKMSPERISISSSMDIPVSGTAKRTLSRAAEEADASKDAHIGAEHLVLGLLTEGGSNVTAILQKNGIDRERVSRSRVTAISAPPRDRETLRLLIDRLPEQALQPAKRTLERLQTFPLFHLRESPNCKRRCAIRLAPLSSPGSGLWLGVAVAGMPTRRDGYARAGIHQAALKMARRSSKRITFVTVSRHRN
jgi:hypothetical protein